MSRSEREVRAGRERAVLEEALRLARRAGARSAEAFCSSGSGRLVEYADRGLETYRGSSAFGIGLRVFLRGRSGFSCGQDVTAAGLRTLAARAVESARLADLPGFALPAGRPAAEPLSILDEEGLAAPVAEDRARLEEVVRQARGGHPDVERVKRVSLASHRRATRILSSAGTDAAYEKSTFTLTAGVVATRDGQSEMGWESDAATRRGGLLWADVGRVAAERAGGRLGAGRPGAGRQPVILDREVTAEFLSFLGSALSADAVLKKKSLYAGKVGTQQAAACVTVVDDPTLPGAVGSAPCDDEGQPGRRAALLSAGVLTGYLQSLETAQRMGVAPSGNGFRRDYAATPLPRPSNLVLLAGAGTVAGWARGVRRILLVDEILGAHTMNAVSGDFSVGASGFILAGRRRRPFRGATIAGNVRALFTAVREVGADLRFFGPVAAPSLLVGELDVSA
jgi:PmbA protein